MGSFWSAFPDRPPERPEETTPGFGEAMAVPGYNEVVLDHYRHPRNVGEIEGSPATAQVGDPATGDVLKISLRIEDGRVVEAKFKSFGCTAAIAVGSMTTILVAGRTVDQDRRRSEEHTSELQSRQYLVCRLLLEKKEGQHIHQQKSR